VAANEIIGSNLKNHSQKPVVNLSNSSAGSWEKYLEDETVNALKNLIYNIQSFNDLLQLTLRPKKK
tara:strand:- start:4464 stop:4661 length:198 start_codon:yes stop_codon:yes gene_type:complete